MTRILFSNITAALILFIKVGCGRRPWIRVFVTCHFSPGKSINASNDWMIFEVSKRVDKARLDALARPRIVGRPWSCNGRYLFPTAAKGDRDGQKQESTYVRSRSVPLRDGEDTTDSVASKGVSFRVVSDTSVTPGVIYLPVRSTRLCQTVRA